MPDVVNTKSQMEVCTVIKMLWYLTRSPLEKTAESRKINSRYFCKKNYRNIRHYAEVVRTFLNKIKTQHKGKD